MKTLLLFGLLLFNVSLKAQENFRIHYDNEDNTVVRFLSQPIVPLILAENQMSGFATLNFTVSKEGRVVAINNLINSSNKLILRTAKEALNRSSGHWIIKPGLDEQNFQITFFITSERLDSLRKAEGDLRDWTGKLSQDYMVPLSQYVQYEGKPMELTILPTINIIFKQMVYKPKRFD